MKEDQLPVLQYPSIPTSKTWAEAEAYVDVCIADLLTMIEHEAYMPYQAKILETLAVFTAKKQVAHMRALQEKEEGICS